MKLTSLPIFLLGACLTLGCSSTITLTPDAAVPFATGEIDPSFEENGNNQFTLKVKHLGPPSKLAPGATAYVVWIKPKKEGATHQNVGVLTVDDDSHEGELEFTNAAKSFDVSITAETAADVLKPSGRDVLKGAVSGG